MILDFKFQNIGWRLTVASCRKQFFIFLFLLLAVYCSLPNVQAQRRDHLTEAEIELVREAQQIDERMKVFVKAIDRRFLVLKPDASLAKQIEKDSDKWGALPTGTRQQIFIDIEKLLGEAISKIDDVASRDTGSDFFPAAVHILADGAREFLPQLKSELDKATDDKEKGAIIGAIDYCNQIIEASSKVKRESPKEIKKRKEKENKSGNE